MKIKFGDLSRQYKSIENEVNEAIKKVISSGWYLFGKELESFEKEFASYCGAKYAVGVANCTDALAISLLAIGVSYKDEVVTTTHTAIPTGIAITQVSAKPVFVDILKDEQTIDPNKLENKITKRTKAIIPVHLYGLPAKLDIINETAKKYNISVIEDAAQAHGAIFNGCKIGASGNLTCFSFYPTKNLGTYGDGGIITLNDYGMNERLKKIRNYGQSTRYISEELGMNSRLDEVNAAVLRVKLKYLDRWNQRRAEIADIYDGYITDEIDKPIRRTENYKSCDHLYVIRSEKRTDLQAYLEKNGIQTLVHYPTPLHLQPSLSRYSKSKLPIAERNAEKLLSLPLYPELTNEEVYFISESVNSFFKK